MHRGSTSAHRVTELLLQWRQGDSNAREELIPLIYGELRRVARYYLRHERPDHTLQSGALVHEAYLRLVGEQSPQWEGRTHFFGVAAQVMRHVLVDQRRYGHRRILSRALPGAFSGDVVPARGPAFAARAT